MSHSKVSAQMSDTFVSAAAGLYHWMMANHIDPKGMRVVLSMPDGEGKADVEMAILREIEPMMRVRAEPDDQGALKSFEMHGVEFRLQARKEL